MTISIKSIDNIEFLRRVNLNIIKTSCKLHINLCRGL
jgi:hypothetical protein